MAKSGRKLPEVNSAPMADIAFLLLIFFLVTTTIASDKGILQLLPPPPEEDIEDVIIKEKDLFKILVNSQDMVMVEGERFEKPISELRPMIKEFVMNFAQPKPEDVALYNSLPGSLKALTKRDPASSASPQKAIVTFKTDRGSSYEIFINILDEIHAAYNEIYGERVGLTADEFRALDMKDPKQKAIYKRARQGIPKNISIAEPNKIGG